tara:strand:+ start:11197 stop:12588 length:1392 start_codon:yes stop_codon:yes gene_type:complete
MNKKQLMNQIRNLSTTQCEQLGVSSAYSGPSSLKAVEAWLGDAMLLDGEGNALDLEMIFADGDPAAVSLHAGMPVVEEVEETTEEVISEMTPTAVEEVVQASVRRALKENMPVKKQLALPRPQMNISSSAKKSEHFNSSEDQYLAGQWIGAKLLKRPESIKWWNNNAPSGLKGQTEGTNSAGGFLVPDPLEAAILDVRETYGVARKVCRTFPMTAETLNIPSLTSGSTVYYPGEATAITESSAVWANVACTAVKRAALMKWSAELGADALFNMADTLADYMGRALGIREDTEFIQGDGTGSFGSVTGLKNKAHSFVTGAGDTWAELTLANLVSTVGLLDDKYHPGASWIMSRQFFGQVVLRVIAAAGGNTIDSLGVGSTGSQLLGYPIHFSDQCPITTAADIDTVYFGNWADAAVFGDRQGIEIATSEHVNFAEDQINIRATSRYDIQVHDGSAFVALATAAS